MSDLMKMRRLDTLDEVKDEMKKLGFDSQKEVIACGGEEYSHYIGMFAPHPDEESVMEIRRPKLDEIRSCSNETGLTNFTRVDMIGSGINPSSVEEVEIVVHVIDDGTFWADDEWMCL